MPTKKQVLSIFKKNPLTWFRVTDILRALKLDRSHRQFIRNMLKELEEEGKVHKYKSKRYRLLRTSNRITGTISITKKGHGYLRPDSDDTKKIPSVFIKRRNLGAALPGDRVLVQITKPDEQNPEGRIVKILEHKHRHIVAQFYFAKKGGMATPRDSRINRSILLPKLDFRNKLKNGIWIMARILDFGTPQKPMLGEISDVIGKQGEPGIDILLVIRDYGVTPEFPQNVREEAENLPHSLSPEELSQRKDLRKLTTFTIDPETAKDFDDALSIEQLPDSRFRLGVHIADVAHYVKTDSAIDVEACDRATSIYPVDRVIPMLPKRLSNNLCSLRPETDRAAMSVFMDVDFQGKIHNCKFYNAVIHSKYRLNYAEVQTIFDRSDPWISSKYSSIKNELFMLKQLSERLIAMRERNGALDLDVGETDVVFDSSGEVIDIRTHPRLASHRLVEQCMILANEAVAKKIRKLRFLCVYRIHEPPSQDKLTKLAPFLANFGILVPKKQNITPKRLQKILERIEDQGEAAPILRRIILRAMMRAKYSPQNKGHYGLASSCYAHFTSPIRRYPDLLVHRILKQVISGEYKDTELRKEWDDVLPEWADHCSDRERRADQIEKESTYIKGLEFMKRFLGFEFEGLISGIAGFGMFVQITRYPIEGMIPIATLGKEYFEFEEDTLTLVGRNSGRAFRLGDPVKVQIQKIDIFKQEMDLKLLE